MIAMSDDARRRIDAYVGAVRRRLRAMRDADADDLIEELRSHVIDKATVDGTVSLERVDAALDALGAPEALAARYVTDDVLDRADATRSPLVILEGLFRWATLSTFGFAVLIASLLAYFIGGALILCALLKPLHPHTAGLWVYPVDDGSLTYSLRMGFGAAPDHGRDVLRWWIVPIGLGVGCAMVIVTTRCALWCGRVYRRIRPTRVER